MGSGTRLRHFIGPVLTEIEDMLESLPYKAEIRGVTKDGQQWYIHYLIPVGVLPSEHKKNLKNVNKKSRRKSNGS